MIFNRWPLLSVLLLSFLLCCTKSELPENNQSQDPPEEVVTPSEPDQPSEPEEDEPDDDPVIPSNPPLAPKPIGGTPDYNKISGHPRVIFTQDDFNAIKQILKDNSSPIFIQLHNELIQNADRILLLTDKLEYGTYDDKRMLNTCEDALTRILTCAYAYKTTANRNYLDQAVEDLKTVCNFKDWNALRHGLDGAVMGVAVALGYDWLYGQLDQTTRNLCVSKLKAYWLDLVRTQYLSFQHKFYDMLNNWNQVCCAGIVTAALAIYEKDATNCKSLIQQAISKNAVAVETMYKPDGNYPEGYSYWSFGTNYQMLLNAALYLCTGSEAGLAGKSGFKESGKYMLYMEGPTKMCFNYSDSPSSTGPCYAQWYYAWQFGDLSYLYNEKSRLSAYDNDLSSGLLPLSAYFAYKMGLSSLNEIEVPKEKVWKGDGINPVVLVHSNWRMDDTDQFLGIKGGKASANHGHMDAGSFVYDSQGVRWSADFGLQVYSTLEKHISNFWSMAQDSGRWTAFRYMNTSHSTLTINSALHRVSGEAEIEEVLKTGGKYGAVLDMTAVLSDQAKSVTRTIYIQGNDLIVEDKITARSDKDAKVRWNMVTYGVPTLTTKLITLKSQGKTMYLTEPSNLGVTFKTWKCQGTPGEDFGRSFDYDNPNMYMCGYEYTIAKNTTKTIKIKLSRINL